MIEKKFIQQWKMVAAWLQESQVEQDLIISRALCELYSEPKIQKTLAFRGGTSLQKIFFKESTRYSEDIDLVQIPKEPIGDIIDLIRKKLTPWLGKPQVDFKTGRVTLRFKYESSEEPSTIMKLKIETNNAEHFCVFGYQSYPFKVNSQWFSGSCQITTFALEEILGTKLRALYQRKKGRDLYDLFCAFKEYPELNCEKIIQCFLTYMEYGGHQVSRAEFEMAIEEKKKDVGFTSDIDPLLPIDSGSFSQTQAFDVIATRLIALLPGEAWKRSLS